jgi:hypothetical protein
VQFENSFVTMYQRTREDAKDSATGTDPSFEFFKYVVSARRDGWLSRLCVLRSFSTTDTETSVVFV